MSLFKKYLICSNLCRSHHSSSSVSLSTYLQLSCVCMYDAYGESHIKNENDDGILRSLKFASDPGIFVFFLTFDFDCGFYVRLCQRMTIRLNYDASIRA